MSSRKSQYLFYTEYYLISGAYHIVNVVNDVLTYTASCSDHIKGYLQNKVINKKTILKEIVYNSSVVVNDPDVDEDGFVVIKMRRPKLKNDAVTNTFKICPILRLFLFKDFLSKTFGTNSPIWSHWS